jgi:hypothetical protein
VYKGLEILELTSAGEFWQVRAALDDQLAVPFEVHKSIVAKFTREDDLFQYLGRQTRTMLEVYGDAREHRPEPDDQFVV